jgi:hypothetical protein
MGHTHLAYSLVAGVSLPIDDAHGKPRLFLPLLFTANTCYFILGVLVMNPIFLTRDDPFCRNSSDQSQECK